MPSKKPSSGLGRAIINRKAKDARELPRSSLYTAEFDSSTKLRSVTQENDLDEFLNTAQLAGTEFTAEKQNVVVIQDPAIGASSAHNPFLLSAEDEKEALRKHALHRSRLRVPRRPPWTRDISPEQLERQERDAFLDWRRALAELQEGENLLLTPFERNLEVWRQLWRVLERSHLVVQIVDARNPLRFRCQDLEQYVLDIEGSEGEQGTGPRRRRNLLLINKSDLLTPQQRCEWADYFDSEKLQYAFYSALEASSSDSDEPDVVKVHQIPDPAEEEEASIDSHSPPLEQDKRIQVLSVQELQELFARVAPDLSEFANAEGVKPSSLVVGLVGYPNVGKSSTINSLIGAKKVSVSSTPGKTKHFQTIPLSPELTICDCPGLVFPQFATTKADLVCDGVLPIDQMREHTGPTSLVVSRIPREILEMTYGLTLVQETEDGGLLSGSSLLIPYAIARGFTRSGQGNPDEARTARYILKDYVNAKLLYCHPPPGSTPEEFNSSSWGIILEELHALGKKKAPVTRVTKGAETFIHPSLPVTSDNPAGMTHNFDGEFFERETSEPRLLVQGSRSHGQTFTRVQSFPHQNGIADDGRRIAGKTEVVGDSSKKHFKRNKKGK